VELHAFPLVAIILAIAAAAGLLALRLRQLLIVAFIGVGILVGPVGMGWVQADSTIELLARMGIAILLFLVGLRLDLHLIRSTGPVALATGLGQVVFTSVFGYLIAIALGMNSVTALYVAVALTFSSTIIIIKLLSDKRELDELHGRIAVGFLIVQDIVVVLVMIALTAFGQPTGDNLPLGIAVMLGKGLGLLAGIGLLMRYVLPWLLHHVARSQELLVLFGVAYVDLGARLEFSNAAQQITEAAVFSVFVLIGNPLIVVLIMAALRYPVRVGFLAGLTVAQISEFSLILAALGLSLGHITNATVSLITVVGLITIGGSTYLIMYSHQIYLRIQRFLAVFERSRPGLAELAGDDTGIDVILYGLGRFGSHLADRLSHTGYRILAVDFDPHRVSANTRDGVTAVFGSAEDIHLLDTLPLARARYVISSPSAVSVSPRTGTRPSPAWTKPASVSNGPSGSAMSAWSRTSARWSSPSSSTVTPTVVARAAPSRSNSLRMSPTSSSRRSSRVTMPSVPPYPSTTTARWLPVCRTCDSAGNSALLPGRNVIGRTMSPTVRS